MLERMRGYIEAHRDFQVEFKEENIYEGDYLFESGYEIGKKLLETSVSAVFSSNNLMLCGVLKALKEREKEIQLACFEKTDFFQLLNREIISCSIPLEEMGEKIYELFINKSKNKKIYIEPILS